MAHPVYQPPDLYNALVAEGYNLPALGDSRDITLEMPVDGIMQLVFRFAVDPEDLGKIARALARIADAHLAVGKGK